MRLITHSAAPHPQQRTPMEFDYTFACLLKKKKKMLSSDSISEALEKAGGNRTQQHQPALARRGSDGSIHVVLRDARDIQEGSATRSLEMGTRQVRIRLWHPRQLPLVFEKLLEPLQITAALVNVDVVVLLVLVLAQISDSVNLFLLGRVVEGLQGVRIFRYPRQTVVFVVSVQIQQRGPLKCL